MRCPNPKCKGGPRLETKQTFDELHQVRRVKACPKCGQRVETIELFKTVHDQELKDANQHAQDLSNIIGQREDKLLEIREAVQVLIRQVPPEALEVLSTPEKGKSLLTARKKGRKR